MSNSGVDPPRTRAGSEHSLAWSGVTACVRLVPVAAPRPPTRSRQAPSRATPHPQDRGGRRTPSVVAFACLPVAGTRPALRSALRLLDGRGQGAEDGEHGVEVGQAGAEAVDEVGQREFAVEQVLVV